MKQAFQMTLQVRQRGDLLGNTLNVVFNHGVHPSAVRSGVILEGQKVTDFRQLHAMVAAMADEV